MTNFILVDTPRARERDPETSHIAAAQVKDDLPRQQHEVLQAVIRWPGRTASELAVEYAETRGVHWREVHAMVHKRLSELNGVRVYKGADRICMISGHRAATWRPIPERRVA